MAKALVAPLFLTFILFGISRCVSFQMKPAEISTYFATRSRPQPRLLTYQVDDWQLNYAEVGDRSSPLVLFVHGSPGSWDAFIHFLADADLEKRCHIVSVDRPGFGSSERGRHQYDLQKQASALKPILETNASGTPALLVGHSFGGPVIARFAMDYPDLVGGLILIAASIDPELETVKWYQKAAEQGDVRALFIVGVMYYDGQGTPKNYFQSYVWQSIASAQGHESAGHNLKILERKMSPEQISQAQQKAAALWEKIKK